MKRAVLLFLLLLLLPAASLAQVNTGGGGGAASTPGNPFFTASSYGCVADNGTTDNSTCFATMNTAAAVAGGTIYFPYGSTASNTYGFNSAPAVVSANNITIACAPGVILKQTTANILFSFTGANDTIRDCTLDGASVGTVPVTVTGAGATNDSVVNNIIQNWAATGTDGWITSKQSDGLYISRNKLVTGLTASNGISLNSLTGIVTRAWIVDNELVAAEGTTANVAAISLVSNSGGALNDIWVRNNNVTWADTGASSAGFFSSNTVGAPSKIYWDHNSCKLSAAAVSCYHLYGDLFGVITGNFADDATFVSSNPLFDLGDIGNTPVTDNTVRVQAVTSGGGMRVIDGQTNGNGGVEPISNNTIDNPGTGGAAVGLDVAVSVANVGIVAVTGNVVRLNNNGLTGIRLNAVANKSVSNSTISGNTVTATGGTGQTGIQVRAAGTTVGTTQASHIAITGNVVSGVATGIALNALSTNSAGAAVTSHVDEAQVVGNICDTVTTCISASAVNSGTSVSNVASVDHLQVSDLQINGATTGISTSVTVASGAATMNGTQIGPMSVVGVTTPISLGGSNERAFTHTVSGSIALNNTTAVTVTLNGSDVFTSATSYFCSLADLTAASAFSPKVAYTSGSVFTLTGIASNTDTIQYVCTGG